MWFKTIRLLLLLAIVLVVAIQIQNNTLTLHRRAEAHGDIKITYLHAPLDGPIFNVDDMKPGDCEVRVVKVENSTNKSSSVSIKPKNIIDEQGLGSAMNITIYDQDETYFEDSVESFYASDWISLGKVDKSKKNEYTLRVCMPAEIGNEFQATVTSFDLAFNTKDNNQEDHNNLPTECRDLKEQIKNTVIGTLGDDVLNGTSQNDFIDGKGGNDIINGKSGHDCIVGGDGNDNIRAGSGADIILGGKGQDDIDAESGDDKIYGGDDNDTIKAGSGDDYLDGGSGFDKLNGESGRDTCVQGEQNQNCER